jgi:hypothetical protein
VATTAIGATVNTCATPPRCRLAGQTRAYVLSSHQEQSKHLVDPGGGSNDLAGSRGCDRQINPGSGGRVKISLLLADAAQADAASGKVNALGLGWRQCQTPTPAFTLVLFLDIDWDETNKQHKLKCQLLTTDGDPVVVAGAQGPQRILFEAAAEAGRPPGSIHGTSVRMPLTLNIPAGIPLEPGIYEWRVEVEGFEMATAVEAFVVIGPAQAPTPAG